MATIVGRDDTGLDRIVRIGEDGNLYVEGVMPPGTSVVTADIQPVLIGGADASNLLRALSVGSSGELQAVTVNALVPVAYDYIDLSYTGADLTGVVFKSGGAAGTTVATLTLAYSGGKLSSVTRT